MVERDYAYEAAVKTAETEKRVKDAFEAISRAINGGWGDAKNMLANEVGNENPTLSGQFAKAVAIGIVRRSERDPEWKPWGKFERLCTLPKGSNYADFSDKAWEHPDHDGRHDCSLVVGAILMSRQSYI